MAISMYRYRFANAVGALATMKKGAIAALPTSIDVAEFLRRM
jgi:sugar/nucleoside kinase (ribokinase family)